MFLNSVQESRLLQYSLWKDSLLTPMTLPLKTVSVRSSKDIGDQLNQN